MPGVKFDVGFGDMRPVHARFAMNIGCMIGRTQQWAIHAHRDRDMPDIRQRTDFQGVARGLLY